MSRRPHPVRAKVNRNEPRAWATDMRSGFIGNLKDARWQHDWQGTKLTNLNLLVYPDQLDNPQRQLGAQVLVPDGLPILNPRPGNSLTAEQVINISAAYTATIGAIISCTGTSYPVYLPTAVEVSGQSIAINNNGTGTITATPEAGELINGASSYSLDEDESTNFISNGTSWFTWTPQP